MEGLGSAAGMFGVARRRRRARRRAEQPPRLRGATAGGGHRALRRDRLLERPPLRQPNDADDRDVGGVVTHAVLACAKNEASVKKKRHIGDAA